jgi:hypothetical protein
LTQVLGSKARNKEDTLKDAGEIIPLQEGVEAVGNDAELKEIYDTESQMISVAATHAKDNLLLTSVAPAA